MRRTPCVTRSPRIATRWRRPIHGARARCCSNPKACSRWSLPAPLCTCSSVPPALPPTSCAASSNRTATVRRCSSASYRRSKMSLSRRCARRRSNDFESCRVCCAAKVGQAGGRTGVLPHQETTMPPAAQNGPALEIRDLVKTFGDFVAVDHVSFQAHKGEIFGFLGPNGAGKSTVIRMLCGLLTPTSGWGAVAGFDVTKNPEEIRKNIGYMSQKFSLYDDLAVEENIDFFSRIYGVPKHLRAERKEYVLRIAGLTDRRTTLTRLLAGGWEQRLATGCALVHSPRILV